MRPQGAGLVHTSKSDRNVRKNKTNNNNLRKNMKKPLTTYYSPVEVAEALSVSRRTVYRWLDSGELAAEKLGGIWRISEAQLAAFSALGKSQRKRNPEPVQAAPKVVQKEPEREPEWSAKNSPSWAGAEGATNAERRAQGRSQKRRK